MYGKIFTAEKSQCVQFHYTVVGLSVRFRSTNSVPVVSLCHFSVCWIYSHAAPPCNIVKASNPFTPTPFFYTTFFCFFTLFSLQVTLYLGKLSLTVAFFFTSALITTFYIFKTLTIPLQPSTTFRHSQSQLSSTPTHS